MTRIDAAERPRTEAAEAEAVIQALFEEARQHRRRIRLVRGGTLAALVAIALAVALIWPAHPAGRSAGRGSAAPAGPAARSGQAASLVWVNSDGRVIVGNLRTWSGRVVGEADLDFSTPLVPAGGLVYWVKQSGGYVSGAFWPRVVEALDPKTGRSTVVSPGEYVFRSATGSRVYAALTDTAVAELPPGSRPGRPSELALPPGWYLPAGAGLAVAGGIVVQSADAPALAHPAELAVWNPATGQVRPIGRTDGVIGAYTPPRATYSLLAWMPANCRFPACPITITNTVTLARRTLNSPLGFGFVQGGAFSPDGQHLAVFANLDGRAGGQSAELAVVTVGTGAVRLVPGVRMTVGEDADWVRWLPGGTALLTQANRDYLVSLPTLTARPFRFTGAGQAINFSAELIP